MRKATRLLGIYERCQYLGRQVSILCSRFNPPGTKCSILAMTRFDENMLPFKSFHNLVFHILKSERDHAAEEFVDTLSIAGEQNIPFLETGEGALRQWQRDLSLAKVACCSYLRYVISQRQLCQARSSSSRSIPEDRGSQAKEGYSCSANLVPPREVSRTRSEYQN